ncbi:hypothetical protein FB451DRAFT_617670 [Mycena latifolia]|nr:hypothetical protein FB451DRAFT_617670 [Mycena latifolia]
MLSLLLRSGLPGSGFGFLIPPSFFHFLVSSPYAARVSMPLLLSLSYTLARLLIAASLLPPWRPFPPSYRRLGLSMARHYLLAGYLRSLGHRHRPQKGWVNQTAAIKLLARSLVGSFAGCVFSRAESGFSKLGSASARFKLRFGIGLAWPAMCLSCLAVGRSAMRWGAPGGRIG